MLRIFQRLTNSNQDDKNEHYAHIFSSLIDKYIANAKLDERIHRLYDAFFDANIKFPIVGTLFNNSTPLANLVKEIVLKKLTLQLQLKSQEQPHYLYFNTDYSKLEILVWVYKSIEKECFYIDDTSASQFTTVQWKMLSNNLSIFKPSTCEFTIKSEFLELDQSMLLGQILKQENIKNIRLITNRKLDSLPLEKLNALGRLVISSEVISLTVDSYSLTELSIGRLHLFGEILKNSLVTELNIEWNNLYAMPDERWDAFINVLKQLHLKSLNLSFNDLDRLLPSRLSSLLQVISAIGVSSLNLREDSFHCTDEKISTICKNLEGAYVTFFKLGGWRIYHSTPDCRSNFASLLKKIGVICIDYSASQLFNLSVNDWKAFEEFINLSNATILRIAENGILTLKEIKWLAFCNAIKNSSITSLVFCPDEKQDYLNRKKEFSTDRLKVLDDIIHHNNKRKMLSSTDKPGLKNLILYTLWTKPSVAKQILQNTRLRLPFQINESAELADHKVVWRKF